MATTYAIPDGRVAMAATLWAGTGTTNAQNNAVNGVSFQPDFVWIKDRTAASSHQLYDVNRGTTKALSSDLTNAEYTVATGLTAFNSNGFTVVSDSGVNLSGRNYVGWQWKAGGTAVSNTAGSITSSVSANTTAGFSVVTYTGTGTTGATVGHGLGAVPQMIIVKNRTTAAHWPVGHVGLTSWGYNLYLSLTNAQAAVNTSFNSTTPTSTVFTLGPSGNETNSSGNNFVAYCFTGIAGYSAFGKYTGNGSTDGPFIYTGMRPRFIMVKRTDSTSNWYTYDSSRNTTNPESLVLYPNASYTEDTEIYVDFLSNGFKCRSATVANVSGGTYIYACFAENPFKYANAR